MQEIKSNPYFSVCYFTVTIKTEKWKLEEMQFVNCDSNDDPEDYVTNKNNNILFPYAGQSEHNIFYKNLMIGIMRGDLWIWKRFNVKNINKNDNLRVICGKNFFSLPTKQIMCRNSMLVIDNDMNNDICLLLFGNQRDAQYPYLWRSFLSSFAVLKSKNINAMYNNNNNNNNSDVIALNWNEISSMFGFNLKYNKNIEKLFNKHAFCEFEHFYLNNQYLLFIGGYFLPYDTSQEIKTDIPHGITVFDFKTRIWTMLNVKVPMQLCDYQNKSKLYSIGISNNHNHNRIKYILFYLNDTHGGKYSNRPVAIKQCKLWISRPLVWKIERQVWIGYYKNRKNKCNFAILPKEIICHILKLAQWSLFDRIAHFRHA